MTAAPHQRRRALSTPTTSSEGHASAVRIARHHTNGSVQMWAEGVPFRHLARPTAIQTAPVKAQPAARGCAPGFGCLNHPDCPDQQCTRHPDNSVDEQAFRQRQREQLEQQAVYDLKGKDYSDHHGPRPMAEYHAERARAWRLVVGCAIATAVAIVYGLVQLAKGIAA